VLFGVEEVGLVGKRVVEEGDLGVVSDSWLVMSGWERGREALTS
jgi:hypothetical protein